VRSRRLWTARFYRAVTSTNDPSAVHPAIIGWGRQTCCPPILALLLLMPWTFFAFETLK
jgi:hypothetical protein